MKKKWELGADIDISKLLSNLQKAKTQAEDFDNIMSGIGDYASLKKLAEEFKEFNDVIEEMQGSIDTMQAKLGKTVKGGLVTSLDDVFKKLSQISEVSKTVFSGIASIDLKDSGASAQLSKYAKQLNTLFKNFNVNQQIDIDLFDTKSVKDQFNELIKYAGSFGKEINIAIGNVDLSGMQREFADLYDGIDSGSKKLTGQQKLIENLTKKIKQYHSAVNKRDTFKVGTPEYEQQLNKIGDIEVDISDLLNLDVSKDEAKFQALDEVINDLIDESINAKEAGEKLTQVFGVDLSQAFLTAKEKAALLKDELKGTSKLGNELDFSEDLKSGKNNLGSIAEGFRNITDEANKAGSATQKVMYHIGNLLKGKGQPRDTFGDMAYNLTEAAIDTRYEKYGFGVLGGGLFGVTDPSTFDHEPGTSNFIQSVDLSKYNMYMADTEERAISLIDFLSKLQKFSMKSAEPNYTGFDAYLQGVDVDSLYSRFKVVFDETELTKDKFAAFIDEMVSLLKQAGLKFDEEYGALDFANLSDELSGSENISTRFMKMLGYEGVNVGTTSLDGLGQGSVLFDFEKADIVGYFNDIKSAVQDYERVLEQIDGKEWVGSQEQLEQYARNIDDIITRVQTIKDSGVYKNTSDFDNTLSKLTQIRENIDKILSGQGTSGNSPFETITTGAGSTDELENVSKINAELQEKNRLLEEEAAKKQEILDKTIAEKEAAENELETERYVSQSIADDAINAQLKADKLEEQNVELCEQLELEQKIAREEKANAQIQETNALLNKQKLTYEDILSLVRLYNDETQLKAASDADDWDTYDKLYASQVAIAGKLVPTGMLGMGNDSPDKWLSLVGISAEEASQKIYELYNRTHAISDIDVDLVDEDDIELIQKEKGALEDKLEVLRDIADVYGMQITQKDRNRYEELVDKDNESGLSSKEADRLDELDAKISEADESLEEFGATYDRIILKLSSGKKVEILPDDDGLRKLYRIADEYGDGEYNGFEIDDVQFERAKQQLGVEIPQAADKAEGAVKEVEQAVSDIVYHAGDLSNIANTLKSFPLGNVAPYKASSNTFASLTGLYTTEDVSEFRGNEWDGAPISSIDLSHYKMFDARSDELATKVNNFFSDLNGTIYGYINAIDKNTFEEIKTTDVKTVEQLYTEFKEVFKGIELDFKEFADFIEKSRAIVKGHDFTGVESIDISEQIGKSAVGHALQGVSDDVFNSDNFGTQLIKMLGFEGMDLRGTKFNGTYTGGTIIFDIKPESLKAVNEKWSDVMARNGHEVTEDDLAREEKRRQLAFETAKANSIITDEIHEQKGAIEESVQEQKQLNQERAEIKYFETESGQQTMFDGMSDGLQRAENKAEEVKDTIKEITVLDGQISFDELGTDLREAAVEANKLTESVESVDKAQKKKLKITQGSQRYKIKDFFDADAAPLSHNADNLEKVILNRLGPGATGNMIFDTQTIGDIEKGVVKVAGAYRDANGELKTYTFTIDKNLKITKESIGYNKAIASTYELIYGKQKKANEEAKKSSKQETKKNYKKTDEEIALEKEKQRMHTATRSATEKYNQINHQVESAQLTGETLDIFNKYVAKYKEFKQLQKDIDSKALPIDEDTKKRFDILKKETADLAKNMTDLEKKSKRLRESVGADNVQSLEQIDISDLGKLQQAMEKYASSTQGGKVQNMQFEESTKELTYEVNKGNGVIEKMTISVDEYSNSLIRAKASGKGLTTAFGQFAKVMSQGMTNVFRYVSSFVGFYDIINKVRTGVNYIKEIDGALTELRKVTDETEASYDKFLDRMSETAGVVGSTVSELTTMAAEWGRLGYSLKEAGDLAESTAILLNVSEFQDATAASEALISTIQAFGYAANESMSVVDVLNEIGNSFAVSSDGLAVALQDSASALMTAGNNLEQSVALIAAANKVVQDPNSVGSALRTISLRLRGKIVPYCIVMYKLCALKHSKDNYIGQNLWVETRPR